MDSPTAICEADLDVITPFLPAVYRMANWRLLYSTWEHGITMSTMFRMLSVRGPRGTCVASVLTPPPSGHGQLEAAVRHRGAHNDGGGVWLLWD